MPISLCYACSMYTPAIFQNRLHYSADLTTTVPFLRFSVRVGEYLQALQRLGALSPKSHPSPAPTSSYNTVLSQ